MELTPDELDTLAILAAEGRTQEQTAEVLGVSRRTVVYRIHNITKKLGASNIVQAVYLATREGILS